MSRTRPQNATDCYKHDFYIDPPSQRTIPSKESATILLLHIPAIESDVAKRKPPRFFSTDSVYAVASMSSHVSSIPGVSVLVRARERDHVIRSTATRASVTSTAHRLMRPRPWPRLESGLVWAAFCLVRKRTVVAAVPHSRTCRNPRPGLAQIAIVCWGMPATAVSIVTAAPTSGLSVIRLAHGSSTETLLFQYHSKLLDLHAWFRKRFAEMPPFTANCRCATGHPGLLWSATEQAARRIGQGLESRSCGHAVLCQASERANRGGRVHLLSRRQ